MSLEQRNADCGMSGAFRQFTMFQPMQTTTTSTTWSGLKPISPRCYGCTYLYSKHGTLICGHTSRILANATLGQECVSFVPRNEIDGQPRGDAE